MIALIDCNNFYVSCERVFNPALKNKPVIVLSNNDGCIIARSNESKELGFKMGEPVFKQKKHIKTHNVKTYSTNFALYGDMSNRVMSILSQEAPKIEIYSIDEAFIDLKGIKEKKYYCRKLRKKILKHTGIPTSIGIGKTKTLSKIASRIAKKNKEGIFCINSKQQEKAINNIKINKIWGIGKRNTVFLNQNKIYTIKDLQKTSKKWIKNKISIKMLKTKEELCGKQRFKVEQTPSKKKNIRTSRTFLKDVKKYKTLEEAITTYAMISSEKLRKEKGCARVITIFIETNRYKHHKQKWIKSMVYKTETNDSLEIIKSATSMLKAIYNPKYKYKKAGIILGKIKTEKHTQGVLFDKINREKRKKLMIAIDKINKEKGQGKIKSASQALAKTHKTNNLSPSYTTNWDELLIVR